MVTGMPLVKKFGEGGGGVFVAQYTPSFVF